MPRLKNQHRAELAIAALLLGKSTRKVAAEINIGHRTLITWMKEDWFRSQYDDAKQELLDQTINMLRSAGEKGVRTLESVADNRKAAPTARAAAGRALLEVLLKAVDTQNLAERLREVENRLGILGASGRGPGTRAIDLEEE